MLEEAVLKGRIREPSRLFRQALARLLHDVPGSLALAARVQRFGSGPMDGVLAELGARRAEQRVGLVGQLDRKSVV